IEKRQDTGAESLLDLTGTNVFYLFPRILLGRVVDQNVEAPKFLDSRLDSGFAKRLVTDVSGDGQAATPFTRHQAFCFFGILMLVAIDDGYICSFVSEGYSHR